METVALKLIAPVDLTPDEAQDVQRAFEAEGLSTNVQCAYFVKSVEQAIANFVADFAKEAEHYGMDVLLAYLGGKGAIAIGKAFAAVRKRLADRKVQVRVHLESPHRLSYILPQPPDDEEAIRAIKSHYESLPPNTRGDVFWFENAWITAHDYFERYG